MSNPDQKREEPSQEPAEQQEQRFEVESDSDLQTFNVTSSPKPPTPIFRDTPIEFTSASDDTTERTVMPSVSMPTDTHSPQLASDTEASASLPSDSDPAKIESRERGADSPGVTDDTDSKASDLPLDPSEKQSKPSSERLGRKSRCSPIQSRSSLPSLVQPQVAVKKHQLLPIITLQVNPNLAPIALESRKRATASSSVSSTSDPSPIEEKVLRQMIGVKPPFTRSMTTALLDVNKASTQHLTPLTIQARRGSVSVENVLLTSPPLPMDVDESPQVELEQHCVPSSTVPGDEAAAKLKHTEGVVKLTVCTPNLKDKKEDAPSAEETGSAATSVPAGSTASHPASGNQTPDPGLTAAGSSRPHSPRPAPSPVRTEPPADPATAPIVPNQETVIEIATNSQNLGLFLLGGSDTSINGPAAVVLDVVKDRPVGRDGRLQHGDQIRAACGISLTDAMTEDRLNMTIKQWAPKLKFTVFRPDPIPYVTIEVDINRKQKPLGFSFAAFSNDKGVYIAQILPGSPTEQDGRLKRGDHILTVDGKDISGMDFTSASIALKLLGPKVSIKVRRLKIVR
ncbi:uncharacterized protein LOC113509423 isoform X2 [Galleria mellonella]|uniref:Uncharacterized protein LOC113509423 isoform X2 n=1 Tax=Galleria mellonella TaxID=7137 RepID=A0A6J3C406_GALME|nr:uncharacterized protein LOC113509423 isoform X2 [Galleria mellonella]